MTPETGTGLPSLANPLFFSAKIDSAKIDIGKIAAGLEAAGTDDLEAYLAEKLLLCSFIVGGRTSRKSYQSHTVPRQGKSYHVDLDFVTLCIYNYTFIHTTPCY